MSALKSLAIHLVILAGLLLAPVFHAGPAAAQQPTGRIALVIGDGAYATGALPTAANDAGLVAQTLTAAGFDVTGARDLDGDSIRRAFREFLDKANAAGPDGIAFVYVSGYALQFDGENYVVPVDATLARDADIPIQAVRLGDFVHALAAVPLQSRVVVLDGAYADPAVPVSDHVAPGLALVDPDPGTLIAFNDAPGAAAPTPTGTYGVYGQALAEMMREGGVPVTEVFDRVRLRVNETTQGAVVPWNASKLTGSFVFLERAPDAPATASAQQSFTAMSKRPIREFPVAEAYSMAVARDSFPAYQDFLSAYPQSSYARRVRSLLAVRREALTWRQTVMRNSSVSYWTYLRRYPRGPHVYDCRRRLTILSAPVEPPVTFAPIEYDVPPPPEVEVPIIDEPNVVFVEPDDAPPPPLPVYFLPPEPDDFEQLPPPPPPIGPGFLPIPIPIPIPYARPIGNPGFIAPPRGIPGQYAQPQPFMTSPNGRLVAQPATAPAAPTLRPTAPPSPAVVPAAPGTPGAPLLRPVPGQPLPAPGVQPGAPGRPAPLVQPVRPAGAQPPVPGAVTPGTPPAAVPGRTLPGQPLPVPGAQPGAPGRPAPLVQPVRPAGTQPPVPGAVTPRTPPAAVPGRTLPGQPLPVPGTQPGAPGRPTPLGQPVRPAGAQPPVPGAATPGKPPSAAPVRPAPGQLPNGGAQGRPAPLVQPPAAGAVSPAAKPVLVPPSARPVVAPSPPPARPSPANPATVPARPAIQPAPVAPPGSGAAGRPSPDQQKLLQQQRLQQQQDQQRVRQQQDQQKVQQQQQQQQQLQEQQRARLQQDQQKAQQQQQERLRQQQDQQKVQQQEQQRARQQQDQQRAQQQQQQQMQQQQQQRAQQQQQQQQIQRQQEQQRAQQQQQQQIQRQQEQQRAQQQHQNRPDCGHPGVPPCH